MKKRYIVTDADKDEDLIVEEIGSDENEVPDIDKQNGGDPIAQAEGEAAQGGDAPDALSAEEIAFVHDLFANEAKVRKALGLKKPGEEEETEEDESEAEGEEAPAPEEGKPDEGDTADEEHDSADNLADYEGDLDLVGGDEASNEAEDACGSKDKLIDTDTLHDSVSNHIGSIESRVTDSLADESTDREEAMNERFRAYYKED